MTKEVTTKKTVKKKAAKRNQMVKAKQESMPAVVDNPNAAVMQSLMQALDNGLAPEQLEMVLSAQEKILDRQAKQEFQIAMSACQSEMPNVLKNKRNDQTNSDYADLDSILNAIAPVYTKHGFSLVFGTGTPPDADYVRVELKLMHVGGWSEEFHVDMPLDMVGIKGSANKTKVHATGSAFSYGQRYLVKMVFSLRTGADDDGNMAGSVREPELTEQEIADMQSLIDETNPNMDAFLKFAKAPSVELISRAMYQPCIQMLEKRRRAM